MKGNLCLLEKVGTEQTLQQVLKKEDCAFHVLSGSVRVGWCGKESEGQRGSSCTTGATGSLRTGTGTGLYETDEESRWHQDQSTYRLRAGENESRGGRGANACLST